MQDRDSSWVQVVRRGNLSQLHVDTPPASAVERWMLEDEEIEAQLAFQQLPPPDVDDFLTKIAAFEVGDIPHLSAL